VNNFNENLAREVAEEIVVNEDERLLITSFTEVCQFLANNQSSLSWRGGNKPSIFEREGLTKLAERYFAGYRRNDLPAEPSTIPDEMVSVIMQQFYGYSEKDCQRIQIEHQRSMCAENCVGNLLERYIHSIIRDYDWCWCCGDFVKAIDFLSKDNSGGWIALQIKNRDNSENSSSSAIRNNTTIQKWFRSFSKDTRRGRQSFTNWKNVPSLMQEYNLSEQGFREFVIKYICDRKFTNNV
jgi:hypothetical protein